MACEWREIDDSFSDRYEQLKWNEYVWAHDDIDYKDRINHNDDDDRKSFKISDD